MFEVSKILYFHDNAEDVEISDVHLESLFNLCFEFIKR